MVSREPLIGDPRYTLFAGWFVDCFAQGPNPETSRLKISDPLFSRLKVIIVQFKPHESSVMQNSPNCRASDTEEWIEDEILLMTKRKYAPLHELNRELARMASLFGMIGLDIWNVPYF